MVHCHNLTSSTRQCKVLWTIFTAPLLQSVRPVKPQDISLINIKFLQTLLLETKSITETDSLKGKMTFKILQSSIIYSETWQTLERPSLPKEIIQVPMWVNTRATMEGSHFSRENIHPAYKWWNGNKVNQVEDEDKGT